MGLDQYAYFVNGSRVIDDFSFRKDEGQTTEEDFYWRKNRHLQGWMEDLYHRKGGQEEFNCQFVRLKEKDLDELEKAIKARSFEDAKGFFWGNRKYDDGQATTDLRFVERAKESISNGKAVYYFSWW